PLDPQETALPLFDSSPRRSHTTDLPYTTLFRSPAAASGTARGPAPAYRGVESAPAAGWRCPRPAEPAAPWPAAAPRGSGRPTAHPPPPRNPGHTATSASTDAPVAMSSSEPVVVSACSPSLSRSPSGPPRPPPSHDAP